MNKFLVGFFVGSVLCYLIIFFVKPGFVTKLIGANISEPLASQTILPTFSEAPLVSPINTTERIVSKVSLSTVAVQSFQGSVLKRQGSGIILSSDGLVILPYDLVLTPSMQVLIDDKIIKATVVKKDQSLNLALIKIDATNLTVSDFDLGGDFQSGQELLIMGKLVDLSKPINFVQKAIVSFTTDKKIILDTSSRGYLNGAAVVNYEGEVLGMEYMRSGNIHLVSSQVISDFYNSALNK